MPRRSRRRARVGLALAVAVTLTVTVACGDDDGQTSPTAPTVPEPPPVTLRVAVPGPVSVDPLAAADGPEAAFVASLTHRSLLALDPDDATPIPALATGWEMSADRRTTTLTLDPDARFHDGRAVVAADVVASLDRARDRRSPVAADLAQIATVEATDDATVRIRLRRPWKPLTAMLAHPALGILPAADLAAGGEPGAVGAGRFAVLEESPVLRLGPPGTDPGGDAEPDPDVVTVVEVTGYDSADGAVEAFADDRADLVLATPSRLEGIADLDRVTVEPRLAVTYFGLSLASPRMADAAFREAIVLAIDGPDLVADALGPNARPTGSLLPSSLWSAGEDPCEERCEPDRDRARELVAEAFDDEDPPELTVTFDAGTQQQAVAEALADQLGEIGVTVRFRPRQLADYSEYLATGEADLFRFVWVGRAASPAAFLTPFVSGSADNVTRLERGEVDLLLAAVLGADSVPEARRAAAAAEAAVLAEHVVIPVAELVWAFATAETVEGMAVDAYGALVPEAEITVGSG